VVALHLWRSHGPPGRIRLATHLVDLGFFCLLNVVHGPASPFFFYFVFAMLCGAMRWGARGTLWTAAAAFSVYLADGLYAWLVQADPDFRLNVFVIRLVFFATSAVLVAYLAAHQERLRQEIVQLAAWPRSAPATLEEVVREIAEQAAQVLRVPRVLLVWSEPEEPWRHLALWHGGRLESRSAGPDAYEPLVAEPLAATDFVSADAGAAAPTVLRASGTRVDRWEGAPLHPQLVADYGIGAVLALNLRQESVEGYLFCLDRLMRSDDLLLGEVVGRIATARLDQFYLSQRLRQAATVEERIRLARDLHDGLLQSLTGTALQLESANRLLESQPEQVRDLLQEIRQQIAAEQRDLRFFIRELRPAPLGAEHRIASLAERLEDLQQRIERLWGLEVDVRAADLGPELGEHLERGIFHLVREAVVNAARHAGAECVRVELDRRDHRIRLSVADDGRGFPFHGRFDEAALAAQGIGPKTLRERVAALGGTFVLDSSPAGSRLEITLPSAEG
jgi:signal transduction histidine kinase